MDNPKDKIAKLLAIANDGRGNKFEAEAALRQAQKLMAKHNIDVAELADNTGQKPIYEWKSVCVPAGAPVPIIDFPTWLGVIMLGVARFTDTKVTGMRIAEHGACYKFEGDAVDVEYAVWLAKRLRDDTRRQAAAFVGSRMDKEAFRRAMSGRLQDRMFTLRKERDRDLEAAKTSTSTALVVVNTKLALLQEQFGKQTERRSSTSTGSRSEFARRAGREAGDRASFNRPVGTSQSVPRLRERRAS